MLALAALVALALVGIVGLRLWLETDSGGLWLSRQALAPLNERIAGRVEPGRVEVHGLWGVTAYDVRALTPDGEVAVSAERITAAVTLPGAFRDGVTLDLVRLEGLTADITPGPDGDYALRKAFRAREGPPGSGAPFAIERVFVGVHRIVYAPSPSEGPAAVVERGALRGRLSFGGGTIGFAAQGDLTFSAPASGVARVDIAGTYAQGQLSFERLEATLPGGIQLEGERGEATPLPSLLMLAANGIAVVPDKADGGLIEDLSVTVHIPSEGLVPYGGPLLEGPVRILAKLNQSADRFQFTATARPPGPGAIVADGWATSGAPERFEALVDFRGVDPARVLAWLPAGELWLVVEASGLLAFPPDAQASGALRLGESVIRGERVGPGRARFAVRGARWRIDDLELELPGATVRADLEVGGDAPPAGSAVLDATRLEELAGLARAFDVDFPDASGSLHLEASGSRRADGWNLRLRASSPSLTTGSTVLRSVESRATLAGSRVRGSFAATTAAGRVALSSLEATLVDPDEVRLDALELAFAGTSWSLRRPAFLSWSQAFAIRDLALDGPGRVALELTAARSENGIAGPLLGSLSVEDLALGSLSPLLGQTALSGTLDAKVAIGGTTRQPRFEGTLEAASTRLSELGLDSMDARFSLDSRSLAANGSLAPISETSVRFDARLAAPRGRPIWSRDGALEASGRIEASVKELRLAALPEAGLEGLRGTLSGILEIEAPLARPRVRASFELTNGTAAQLPELPPVTARVRLEGGAEAIAAHVAGRIEGFPRVEGFVRLGASVRELLAGEIPDDTPLLGRLTTEREPLFYPREQLQARAVELVVDAQGTLADPVATVSGRIEGLAYRKRAVGALTVEGAIDEARATARLELDAADGGDLLARAEYALSSGDWSVELNADEAGLDLLTLLPQVREVEGSALDGSLRARSEGGQLELAGELRARAERVTLPSYGRLDGLRLALASDGSRLRLPALAFEAGQGRVEATGELTWRDERCQGALRADLDRLPVPTLVTPIAQLTTRLEARFSQADARIDAELRVSAGEVLFPELPGTRGLHPLELPAAFRVHGHEPPAAPSDGFGAWLARQSARLALRVPRDFWFRSPLMNVELTADLVGLWDGQSLALQGSAEALRGEVTLATRRFQVEDFRAEFTGAATIDPNLEGTLRYDHRDAEIEVEVGGTLRAPELAFRSDPPMDPAQTALLIASGQRGVEGGGVGETAVAGALNLLAGELRDALAPAVPLDVFEVELGPTGEPRRLEAGVYVTQDLFLAFVRNLFAPPGANFNEVLAEYQISRSLSLQTRYGDRQAGSARLVWERRFRSPRQREPMATEGAASGASGPPSDRSGALVGSFVAEVERVIGPMLAGCGDED